MEMKIFTFIQQCLSHHTDCTLQLTSSRQVSHSKEINNFEQNRAMHWPAERSRDDLLSRISFPCLSPLCCPQNTHAHEHTWAYTFHHTGILKLQTKTEHTALTGDTLQRDPAHSVFPFIALCNTFCTVCFCF